MIDYTLLPIDTSKGEIRLLDVFPSSHSNPDKDRGADIRVHCVLRKASLNDKPPYQGLSYCWGEASDVKQISLEIEDGQIGHFELNHENSSCKPLVTATLESALYHLRHASKPITLWVDAICINQTNSQEKSLQVAKMKDIYKSAEEVIIWLGSEANGSGAAMDALRDLGEGGEAHGALLYRRFHGTLSNPAPEVAPLKRFCLETASALPDDFPMKPIEDLSLRPWWQRVWVTQEISVGYDATFVCGHHRVKFRTMAAAMIAIGFVGMEVARLRFGGDDPKRLEFYLKNLNYAPDPSMSTMIGLRRRYQLETSEQRDSLMDLLFKTHVLNATTNALQASFAKDRVYGLLGMAEDAEALGIVPDYDRATATEAVYRDVAYRLLDQGESDLLLICQFPKSLWHLPSWVPDWTSMIQLPCGGRKADSNFRACGETSLSIVQRDTAAMSRGELQLGGIKIDDIAEVGAKWLPTIEDWKFDWEKANDVIKDINQFCAKSDNLDNDIYASMDVRREAHWRIPTADQIRDNVSSRSRAMKGDRELKKCYDEMIGCFGHEVGPKSLSPAAKNYITTMGSMHKRRVFLSTLGYVGLVPCDTQPGDIICILFGVHVPFVLRPFSESTYKLVGEAFVYGVMDGEIVEQKAREKVVFTIY